MPGLPFHVTRVCVILLAVAVALLPIRDAFGTKCRCALAESVLTSELDADSRDAASGSMSCCTGEVEPDPVPEDVPSERDGCPCDDCPRPCCAAVKLVAAPSAEDAPRDAMVFVEHAADVPRGRATPAHLFSLPHPPRHVISV